MRIQNTGATTVGENIRDSAFPQVAEGCSAFETSGELFVLSLAFPGVQHPRGPDRRAHPARPVLRSITEHEHVPPRCCCPSACFSPSASTPTAIST